MKYLKPTPLALALAAAFAVAPSLGQAQSNADLIKELDALKARVQQLESQVRTQSVDTDEFNRIRLKTEALEDNFEAQGFKGLKINGMVDPTYIYSRRLNQGGFVFLNNFDGRGNSGSEGMANDGYAYDNSYFGQAMLDIQKETDSGTKWRLTLAPHKAANSGYNYGSIVHEASVSIPLGSPTTRLIAGQLPDWSGYEYIFSHQQPLITHNLLFDFTIPSFYSGVGMEFTRGKWVSKFMLGNINESRKAQGDKSPGLTYRVDYARGEFAGFGLAGSHSFTSSSTRFDLLEVDGYFVRGNLTMQGQLGYGTYAAGAAANLGRTSWVGASGLVGYKITPRFQLVGRADYIYNRRNGGGVFGAAANTCSVLERDISGTLTGNVDPLTGALLRVDVPCAEGRNGFGPGMGYRADSMEVEPLNPGRGVDRYALSLGFNYTLNSNTAWKFEVRYDGATGAVFQDARTGEFRRSNWLFGSSVVVSF